MKYLMFVLMVVFSLSINAKEKNYAHSDKLSINGLGVIHYDRMMGVEPANWITAKFDFDNVIALKITDINAKNNKCGKKQKKELFYIVFQKPAKAVKSIRIRINGPCLVEHRDAILRLRIKTADEKYYENTITILSAHHYIDGEY